MLIGSILIIFYIIIMRINKCAICDDLTPIELPDFFTALTVTIIFPPFSPCYITPITNNKMSNSAQIV